MVSKTAATVRLLQLHWISKPKPNVALEIKIYIFEVKLGNLFLMEGHFTRMRGTASLNCMSTANKNKGPVHL